MAKPPGLDDRTIATLPTPLPGAQGKSPFVLVLSGIAVGEVYKLPPDRAVRIGRGEEVELQLDDEGISRVHCSLESRGGVVMLRDLGSHNGTWIDGERVAERRLLDGERVQLGAGTLVKLCIADDTELAYQRRMAEVALRDPLSGAFNRRHFAERLESEFEAARRYNHPLAALLLDVDQLKNLNEQQGRAAGDEALRAIAATLQVRSHDVVGRVGGDEFAVLLRETDLAGALALAERVRKKIEEGGKVTVTIGLAVTLPQYRALSDLPQELLGSAQLALERLKQLGGNRIGN